VVLVLAGNKSIQIRLLVFHRLTCAKIAFRTLLSLLFYAWWEIRFPSPTPLFQPLASFTCRYTCRKASFAILSCALGMSDVTASP
jgi:hypothetical protein